MTRQFKWGARLNTPQLSLNNKYIVLSRVMDNTAGCDLNNEERLREVAVKIGLGRVDTQEEIIVEVLLDSGVMELVISLEFAKKQGFKLKKIKKPIYVRNINGSFNKESPIKHTVKINIYYQGHRERTEINVIREQKCSVILGIP